MKLASYLTAKHPNLKGDLLRARMRITPEAFVTRSLRMGVIAGFALAAAVFFYVAKTNYPPYIALIVGLLGGYGTYVYLLQSPKLAAAKIANDIDKEVLFAGRFLLVKINSGTPLVNAFIEASRGYGVNSKYFLEIVRDIELGTPLEEAIERAMQNSPSVHWRKILFQIHNALKLGVDVTHSLEAVLDDISYDYLLQIQRYGKKLSSTTLFYLLLAVVFPSLGMTITTVLMGFTNIDLGWGFFLVVLVVVVFFQVIFMRVFNSIRPKVNL